MKTFTPTPEQIRLAEAVFTAMAYESLVRPIVEAYETAILAKHQFKVSRIWVEKGVRDRVILNRKDSFLLSFEDTQVFRAECFAARDAANLKVDHPEHCPLLVAENLRIQAENALLSALATSPGLESFANANWTMELRAKAIDITLRLLAPFVGNAKQILGRVQKTATLSITIK